MEISLNNLLLPACIFSQFFLLPGSVSSPKVLIGCFIQALKKKRERKQNTRNKTRLMVLQ